MKNLEREIRKYNIVSLTLARGTGSIHGEHERRCLWDLCGKPMIQWSLEVALASKYVNKVVLSCEDEKVLEIGRALDGVMVIPRPIQTVFEIPRDWSAGVFQRQRPRSLFSGEPSIHTNYLHYCFWYLQKYESYVADIQVGVGANEPLCTTESLDKLIEAFFLDEEANMGLSLYPVMPYIYIINSMTKRPFPVICDWGLDRQLYPPLYRAGGLSLLGGALKSTYDAPHKLAYVIVSPEEGADVHDQGSLELAKFYMEKRLKEK